MRVPSVAGVLLGMSLLSSNVSAQEQLAIRSDFLFYGDNTEFKNPFREGETIFGAAARVAAEIGLNDRVTIAVGIFGNQRFGSDDAFELVRPVLSLTVRGRRSSFVFGTLTAPTSAIDIGPDRGGPHALLPALQRETLSFDRPYEPGLAWTFEGSKLRHHFWLEWQQLNTSEHRERFDGGIRTVYRLSDVVAIPVQLHVVHEGGQLYNSGAVRDSSAVATGAALTGHAGETGNVYALSLDLLAVGSLYVPDRGQSDLSRDGIGFFGRAAVEHAGWRGHVIFWRGRNYIKDEGDPNYQSMTRSGDRYIGTRDYSEAGLTRRFTLTPSAVIDVSGRLHRAEGHYEYSFRILSVVSALWRVR